MRRVGFVLGALIIIAGALVPAFAQQPFSDVPLDHWAYNAVNKLAETGLIEGYPDGTFKGKQPLTRYEFAQAIARLMDRVEQMAKQPGPPGPAGPAGAGGGGGLTAEQQALLDRLAKEFQPELKALRSDLDNLTKRVEELEAKPGAKGPVITVSGDIVFRAGLYGTKLGTQEVESTGYPYFGELVGEGDLAPYGGINLPDFDSETGLWGDQVGFPGGPSFIASIPITDALKDSFKAADFLTQRTRVDLKGSLSDSTNVKVQLWTDPLNNNSLGDVPGALIMDGPNQFAGNGTMDTVNIREAWFDYHGRFLAPVDVTIGKQFVKRGLGLLMDNNLDGVKGLKLDWNNDKPFSWGIFWGMLDREQFFGASAGSLGLPGLAMYSAGMYTPKTNGQDNYNLYYADMKLTKDWDLGVSWLQSGFNKEQGWSADLDGKALGLDWYGEFAQLRKWPTGLKFIDMNEDGIKGADELSIEDAGRNAWLGGAKWQNTWLGLTGEYGRIDPGYAFSPQGMGWDSVFMGGAFNLPLSALHPLAEVSAHDINWVDRSLFLDPTNIAKGWHIVADFPMVLGKDNGLKVTYANGKAYNPEFLSWVFFNGTDSEGAAIAKPGKWVDADPVWTGQLTRQLSSNVTAKLLYGRREVDKVMSKQQVPVTTAVVGTDVVDVFAINDAIQVIRAELSVAF